MHNTKLPKSVWLVQPFVLLLISALGCKSKESPEANIANGDDPLAALTVMVPTTRYGSAFWEAQSDSNTTLWQKAKTYCEQNGVTGQGQKPNCGAVASVEYFEVSRHPERRTPGTLRP